MLEISFEQEELILDSKGEPIQEEDEEPVITIDMRENEREEPVLKRQDSSTKPVNRGLTSFLHNYNDNCN